MFAIRLVNICGNRLLNMPVNLPPEKFRIKIQWPKWFLKFSKTQKHIYINVMSCLILPFEVLFCHLWTVHAIASISFNFLSTFSYSFDDICKKNCCRTIIICVLVSLKHHQFTSNDLTFTLKRFLRGFLTIGNLISVTQFFVSLRWHILKILLIGKFAVVS